MLAARPKQMVITSGAHLVDGVVDGHSCGYGAAGGVDVELHVLFGVFGFQVEKLPHDGIGHGIVNGGTEENDPLPQQAGVDVEGALTATGLLDHRGENGAGVAGTIVEAADGGVGAKRFDHRGRMRRQSQSIGFAAAAASALSGSLAAVKLLCSSSQESALSSSRFSVTSLRSLARSTL